MKLQRRLRRLGARALRNGVHVLPNGEEYLEDLMWLRGEVEADGGSAIICEARLLAGITDDEVTAMWRDDVDTELRAEEASGVERVPSGTMWVTRRGIGVDRMASAWLIRRFIDPEARFRFEAEGYEPAAGERRFDMFDAEYTHEGESCTFETLVRRFALRDRALAPLGEIVHDVDCKDGKFARPEAPGIALVVDAIRQASADDRVRLERGGALFDDLYARFRQSGA